MFYPNQRNVNRPTLFHPQQYPMTPHHQIYQHPMRQSPYPHNRNKSPRNSMLVSAFVNENGTFDVGRTIETVDQIVKTVNQVTPIVYQISNFFLNRK